MELGIHLETMKHELDRTSGVLESIGYRVDGEKGVKSVVGLEQRKSVDYFFEIKNKCQFLEFTDLARGQEDLLGIEEFIKGAQKTLQKIKLSKLVKQDSRRELVEKFKDSKDIFIKIPIHYQNIPETFVNFEAKIFYIVHAPINDELSRVEKATIARFLSTLQGQVSNCLEDDICERVKLILLDQFIEEVS